MFLHHGYLLLPATRQPDLERLGAYFTVYFGASPCDRSNTIRFPTHIKSIFPLPQMRQIRATYKELCHQRAIELLEIADQLDTKMFVFWSGGVDSTCALVCLLEHCKDRERIVVLLNEQSILEYPLFFMQHIAHRLNYQSTDLFPDLLVAPNMIVNGEHNDQLFGSDIMADAINLFGMNALLGTLKQEYITSLYEWKLRGNREHALFLAELVGRLAETATVPIKTNYDLLWWINFTLKWQTVYMRPLIFSKNPLSREYINTYYHPFFGTTEFQLWSMNNPDKKIKDNWKSYKWPAKDVIYDCTGDRLYRDNKTKYGSLGPLLRQRPFHNFIDENFAFHRQLDWYRPQNDFLSDFQARDMRSALVTAA